MRTLIWSLLVMLAIVHQDFWWRADHRTLVFGFLPVSLAYHICISIAACILWGLACRYCWPSGADVADEDAWVAPPGGRH
ncbi:MAG: hypothetical protein ACKVS9_07760 [Phycisphaerae bacterium]